jgi:AraC-like DNA-binding protein
MQSLEAAIRLVIVGQVLLIALIFLSGTGNRVARVSGALFMIAVASYLCMSSQVLRTPLQGILPVIMFMTVALPYFLWTFARCIFDSPLPPSPWLVLFVTIGIAVWMVFVAGDSVPAVAFDWAFVGIRLVSLIIVGNTLWLAAIGRRDDLLERRRRFRPVFVSLVSIQVIAVLIVELVLGTDEPPSWLAMMNVIVIGAMTMGLSIPLLRLAEDFFPTKAQRSDGASNPQKPGLGAADRVLYDKLTAAMDAGSYRQTGLTISALAEQLGYPEHQLRRLINRHLGFRNFSFFLNSLRIEEATSRLADPEQARTPILTIALDLGYASLGPFNRAFREFTGMTPSAWREQAIPPVSE